jgi:hypothetical protein
MPSLRIVLDGLAVKPIERLPSLELCRRALGPEVVRLGIVGINIHDFAAAEGRHAFDGRRNIRNGIHGPSWL